MSRTNASLVKSRCATTGRWHFINQSSRPRASARFRHGDRIPGVPASRNTSGESQKRLPLSTKCETSGLPTCTDPGPRSPRSTFGFVLLGTGFALAKDRRISRPWHESQARSGCWAAMPVKSKIAPTARSPASSTRPTLKLNSVPRPEMTVQRDQRDRVVAHRNG
jgi:hypothetical protein